MRSNNIHATSTDVITLLTHTKHFGQVYVSKCVSAAMWQTIFRQVRDTSLSIHVTLSKHEVQMIHMTKVHTEAQANFASHLYSAQALPRLLEKAEAHRLQFSPMLSQMTFFM